MACKGYRDPDIGRGEFQFYNCPLAPQDKYNLQNEHEHAIYT